MNVIVLVGIDLGVIRMGGETVSPTSRMCDKNYSNFTPKNLKITEVRYLYLFSVKLL